MVLNIFEESFKHMSGELLDMEGDLEFRYESVEEANTVARILQLDNEIAPKTLEITSRARGKFVHTVLKSNKISTFFATIDDMIFSEKLITNIMKIGR